MVLKHVEYLFEILISLQDQYVNRDGEMKNCKTNTPTKTWGVTFAVLLESLCDALFH